ncbi:MAG: FAD-dependent monooxygenase, partial [Nitrospirae bacterium]|nr:FAD-dependent monooxygenase [Nitrospirota bacterium]
MAGHFPIVDCLPRGFRSSKSVCARVALDDQEFLAEIQAEFGYRLGRFSRVGKRAAYPLVLTKAVRLTATRSVLVGNSAHGLHPVSAQGFNLGMRDVAALCDCVADARSASGGVAPGNGQLLERYATWRRSDQNKLVNFTDNLVRIFGSSRPPTRILRNIG